MSARPARIRAIDLEQAVAVTGATLRADLWWDHRRRCGCPIATLIAATHGPDAVSQVTHGRTLWRRVREAAAMLGLSPYYTLGFIFGWDGWEFARVPYRSKWALDPHAFELAELGWRDGARLRQSYHPEGAAA